MKSTTFFIGAGASIDFGFKATREYLSRKQEKVTGKDEPGPPVG